MAYANATFYLDYDNGIDARTDLTGCNMGVDGVINQPVKVFKSSHGLIDGAVITVPTGTYSGGWIITKIDDDYFTLNGSSYSGIRNGVTITPRGGSSWADAWKTITSGALSTRTQSGDIIRIAKSPDPTSIGEATWTQGPVIAKTFTAATNANPIVITCNNHGYSTGDYIRVLGDTGNTAANGYWFITLDETDGTNKFRLNGSVGNGTSAGTSRTVANVNSIFVQQTIPSCANIDMCEDAWTGNGTGVVKSLEATIIKEGLGSLKLVNTARASTQLLAYKTITSTDFSAYQGISFWVLSTVAITVGNIEIRLYSGTDGATGLLETFSVPAIATASGNYWVPMTIFKSSGSILSTSVQSIAIYCNGALSARTLYFDNFVAVKSLATAGNINLQSLISKSPFAINTPAETYGDEAWCGIGSIKVDGGKMMMSLDCAVTTTPTNRLGYSGATETLTTYKRETIKTTMVSATTTNVQSATRSGLTYLGGYNTATTIIDGETFFDGQNGLGIGLGVSNSNDITFTGINCVRYNTGYTLGNTTGTTLNATSLSNNTANNISRSGTGDTVLNIRNCNSAGSSGLSLSGIRSTVNVVSCCMNRSHGIALNVGTFIVNVAEECSYNGGDGMRFDYGCHGSVVTVPACNYNEGYGVAFISYANAGASTKNELYITTCRGNLTYGMYIAGINNKVYGPLTVSESPYAFQIRANAVNNTFIDVTTSSITAANTANHGTNNIFINPNFQNISFSGAAFSYYGGLSTWLNNVGGDTNSHIGYMPIGVVLTDTNIKRDGSLYSWKMSPTTTTYADASNPLILSIGKVICKANENITVSVWVKRTNVGITSKLMCKGRQIAGMATDISDTAEQADGEWEQLSITLTPTANGIVDIEMQAYGGTTYSVYVDDVLISPNYPSYGLDQVYNGYPLAMNNNSGVQTAYIWG